MKTRIIIFITAFLFTLNLLIPTTVLSSGPPPAKKWKGEGEVLEFESIPVITVKDFLNGKVPEKTQTVWGTLIFQLMHQTKTFQLLLYCMAVVESTIPQNSG